MGIWVNDGTISLVSNSKLVTGTGTAFKSGANPARVGQQLIVYVGASTATYEIERVDSDSSMQIAMPWRGATINNTPYAINTASEGSPSDLSRRAAQVMGYYQGQLDGIQVLLTGTGDVIITTPDGQKITLPSWHKMASSLPSASDFAKSLLDDVSSDAMRDTLEVPSRRDFPSSNDLNTLMSTGFFAIAGTNANWPWASNGGTLLVSSINGKYINQLAFKSSDPAGLMAYRVSAPGGVWSQWVFLYSNKSIVGMASQSGGVPTGAIFEHGINANGEYLKFADGTAMCWRIYTDSSHSTYPVAAVFRKEVGDVKKPMVFVGFNKESVAPLCPEGHSKTLRWVGCEYNGYNESSWNFSSITAVEYTGPAVFSLFSIGRWY